jgi:hypothetical protein
VRTDATRRQLRSFGFLVGGVFALLGTWPAAVHGLPPRVWALVLAAALVLPAAIHPRILAQPYRAWMALGHALGLVNTRIILSLFFYLVLTPVGVVLRWMGKDPMRRAWDPAAVSYRQPREPRPGSHMRQQF